MNVILMSKNLLLTYIIGSKNQQKEKIICDRTASFVNRTTGLSLFSQFLPLYFDHLQNL